MHFGRGPQFFGRWKTTSTFVNGRQPQFYLVNGRQPQRFVNGRRP
jgi:hypothetical protein